MYWIGVFTQMENLFKPVKHCNICFTHVLNSIEHTQTHCEELNGVSRENVECVRGALGK